MKISSSKTAKDQDHVELCQQSEDVVELDLSNKELSGDPCAIKVMSLLNKYQNLTILNLSRNRLHSSIWSEKIGTFLIFTNTLKSLDLSHNCLAHSTTWANYLSKALKTNSSLQHLNLSYNEIGGTAWSEAVDDFTKVNTTLTDLDLSYNEIGGYEWTKTIIAIFKVNTTLQTLNLAHNELEPYTLEKELSENNLKKLNLEGNKGVSIAVDTINALTEYFISLEQDTAFNTFHDIA